MEEVIKVQFSPPSPYGEVDCQISLPLDLSSRQKKITLQVNGNAPAKYILAYSTSATVGYARIDRQYAVNGHITNVSVDWAKGVKREDYPIINVIGTIDNGIATLYLWRKE